MYFKSILLFCIEKWGFLKTLFWIKFHFYVLYWKMMYLKSILLFCIEKWGMRISKNSFRKKNCILMYYIEKWEFWSQFFCFILKNENFLRTLFRKMLYSYVLYWKMMFWSQILCFVLQNEEWGILKTLSEKKFAFLCIILKNESFEVNSFVLYWKMRISKNSFPKNVIFLCIILKNDVLK